MPAAADAVAGGFRRRRSIQRGIKAEDGMSRNYVPVFREGALASYSMFRGFLNAMDTSTQDCSALFICEAATQAAKTGKTGYTVAKAARYNRFTMRIVFQLLKSEIWLKWLEIKLYPLVIMPPSG